MTGPRTAAIVVAGGSGSRFGRTRGKQLVELAGKPVVLWSVEACAAANPVTDVVLVRPADDADAFASALDGMTVSGRVTFADSGDTRQASVASGLACLPKGVQCVVVHDGARPLVTSQCIERVIEALEVDVDAQGAVIGHPSVDTLKVVDSGTVVETPDRSRFWVVQTPQAFDAETLVSAHEAARRAGFEGTDDASLVEWQGGRVIVVPGPRDNMKITLPEDLAYAESVVRQRNEEAKETSKKGF